MLKCLKTSNCFVKVFSIHISQPFPLPIVNSKKAVKYFVDFQSARSSKQERVLFKGS